LIDLYEFLRIVANGRRCKSDAIIFLDRVIDGWWRREGHRLCIDDLTKVLNAELKPELLIVGTGYLGLMKVSNELEEALVARRMEF
jgi:hypothetical protein